MNERVSVVHNDYILQCNNTITHVGNGSSRREDIAYNLWGLLLRVLTLCYISSTIIRQQRARTPPTITLSTVLTASFAQLFSPYVCVALGMNI